MFIALWLVLWWIIHRRMKRRFSVPLTCDDAAEREIAASERKSTRGLRRGE